MIDLSSSFIQGKNALSNSNPFHILVSLDTESPVYVAANASSDVIWDGKTWAAFPLEIQSIRQSQNEVPQTSIKVCNINREVQARIEQESGAVDKEVNIFVVYIGDLAETDNIPKYKFKVISSKMDAMWVSFTLGVDSPHDKSVPNELMLKNFCRYKKYHHSKDIRCPYEGSTYTTCNRTLADCIIRNGDLSHRFGGFPSIGKNELYS